MLKILVVDDETRQLTALANIIHKLKPEYEVAMAGDGWEAYQCLQQEAFDLLITDIKMPNMDGLELIEKLGAGRSKLKIVIISGFAEFAYAQKAIAFGVTDYLVKPIRKVDLEKILDVVENTLLQERLRNESEAKLQQKLDNSLPVYIEHQLNKWIQGKIDEKGIEEIGAIFPSRGMGVILLTHLKGLNKGAEISDEDIRQDIKFKMKETLNAIGHSISFFLDGEPETLVTLLNTDRPFNLLSYENERQLTEFIRQMKDEFGIIGTIGISEKAGDIFEEVVSRYAEAKAALDKKFYCPSAKIIHFKIEEIQMHMKPWSTEALETELSDAIARLDKNLCFQLTSKASKQELTLPPEDLKEALILLMLHLSKALRHLISEEEQQAFKENCKLKISECEDYQELWHVMNALLSKLIDYLDVQRNDINAVIVQKCKKYLEENYAKEITLDMISQKYHFSSAYFSNLFKEYTEQSFSKYLTNIRLKNAQNLLVTTELSMSDIALNVGIADAAYFNRIFKKELGIAPNKYRQMKAHS